MLYDRKRLSVSSRNAAYSWLQFLWISLLLLIVFDATIRSRLVVTDQIIDDFRDNPTFASFLDFSLFIFENFRCILLVT